MDTETAAAVEPTYILRLVGEPNEEPIILDQRMFDAIVKRGLSIPAPTEPREEVDFATLETVDDADLMFSGVRLAQDIAEVAFGRGLAAILVDALDREELAALTSQDADPEETDSEDR